MGSRESGCSRRARETERGGVAWNGSRQRAAMEKHPTPERRIRASALRPGGVASATMGSESSLGLDRCWPHAGHWRFAQPALCDQVLLRDAEDVLRGVIEVQPRCE